MRTAKLANTLKKGHRIRLTITSSADQSIFPNHNTGHNPATDTRTELAIQRVYNTKDYPRHIENAYRLLFHTTYICKFSCCK
ncbi:CocE/NonD family hydrolase C-terminal non-catalytic domain-containing protein [Sporosarcina sp. Te-1]|uniref:CocE/NonD family hydrolase C-terminal non-catalytic domain-containing protein n=1 Tax=Sporosarcina sp. Te-1 TaxID=2818390 RepID=UPI0035301E50